ncbi:MAG: UDP-N-acetylmuramoylalanine-D-glutamate ligase, UDP-N-acetylmuramoylalanine-D-glutamate ligase [Candidatus Peregrinibacteria bacterium GW2011_GWF2_43_17]|nr:MAG: UDP-N-acetylmuramoylalanine-D-glutamate ligase, UDP-N-acetylmuramoylalanine-D-glutamate ligase [Candidatus Peregrinibacteria bacterium GW2011_GWF2_43_17]HAU39588.1 UDP-N-acetylmuramoyl-L-alanine--D-glutamate ligase [Candidatus Peregrinibacteria bacterium]
MKSKIAILGFGIEGESIANYLLKKNYKDITICDSDANLANKPKQFKYILGPDYLKNLNRFDIIFRSPGIPFQTKEVLLAGKKATSVTRYFFEHCPCKIIAVTGTKGKGTTSTLAYEMLKKAGRDAYLGGNIGNSPLDFLDKLKKESIVVLELGHGQIEDLETGPDIGIILGVTQDHLDYHPDIKTYRSAKHPLISKQKKSQIAIINEDYEGNEPFLTLGEGRKFKISTRGETPLGAYAHKQKLIIKTDKKQLELIDASQIKLLGPHNIENALPSSLAAFLSGVSKENIVHVLKTFRGLPHRLEFVCEKNGIKFINDSFSTTPETSIAAINSFATSLILVAGGSEKHADFTSWAEAVKNAKHLKQIILIGLTGPRMAKAIGRDGRIMLVKTLENAFLKIRKFATKGDTVVMSPACASFDQFKNYKERGEAFKNLSRSFAG